METETSIAHFSITGDALTDLARDFFVADAPAKAWRFLKGALIGGDPGLADQVARDVLDGKSRLTGDSNEGIGVEDDSDPSYAKNYAYIYAGRVRIMGAWYRPRAEVVSGGQLDGEYAMKAAGRIVDENTFGVPREFQRARVEYHCGTGERVVEVRREVKTKRRGKEAVKTRTDFLVFEPCSEPPFWWPEHSDPSAALADFLAKGHRLTRLEGESPMETPIAQRMERKRSKAEKAEEAERLAQLDRDEEERERRYKAQLAEITAEVRKQAGDDVFELTTKSGRKLTIPRAPFWNWALRRTTLRHIAPPWTTVSPSGMKLPMDDEYHTDWMLGAGLDLSNDYHDDEIRDVAWHEMFRLQNELGDCDAAVVLPGRGIEITGVVGKHITVLPDLEMDKQPLVVNALVIITETGGPMKHCALYAIEKDIPILLVPDAMTRFPKGTKLTLNTTTGSVVVHSMP